MPTDTQPTLALPLEAAEIMRILPHRYPFLLVDRVVELEPGMRAVAIKQVTANEPQFTGHFPGRPIMPGVLIVEALAQTAGVAVLTLDEYRGNYLYNLEDETLRRFNAEIAQVVIWDDHEVRNNWFIYRQPT